MNNNRGRENLYSVVMSDKSFRRLSEFIQGTFGIKMPASKKVMLEGRLRRRLSALGMTSFDEYCDHVLGLQGKETELIRMIDAVTTNKTEFFRGPEHFDYLLQTALPELVRTGGSGMRRPLNVWSAGCSTGEEPYTLSMILSEFAERQPGFRFTVLATDISTRVLEESRLGIYEHHKAEPIPLPLRKKYLLRSKDRSKDLVRICPRLRSLVTFQRLNLMDRDFEIKAPMDVIFCRNVIIYFDRPTQESLLNRLIDHLLPGGYLFIGHSETLNGLNVPVVHIAATIYRKPS